MASLQDDQEVNLYVEGKVFIANKNVLCEYSDYFSAMFSGQFMEYKKKDIAIDVIDANSMDVILKYMNIGLIDLSEFSLESVGTLAMAANFLQITELIRQIEYWLDLQLTISNWIEIMNIAERASYTKLEHLAGSFGLLSFKDMKPEYIPNVQKLFWYLSHPYLDTKSELDVFKFGYSWMIEHGTGTADNLLIILGCLDVKKLTNHDLKDISLVMADYENSLVAKVFECFKLLLNSELQICLSYLVTNKPKLIEDFTESVYSKVFNIVQDSNERKLHYTAVTPIWAMADGKLLYAPHELHTFKEEKGFEKWLEIADKDVWGFNLAVWGANKLVQVCGEHGRGTGRFMKDARVYDTLKEEWTQHGVQLPSRRHAGVTVHGDLLFIVGGVGAYRVIEDSTIIYDLKKRTYRKASKFPEAIQSPAICLHHGSIYASGHRGIYKFVDMGDHDSWKHVLRMDIRANRIISFKDSIYCTQNYFSDLYRFRPGIDLKLIKVDSFSCPPIAFCKLQNRLLVFTRSVGQTEELRVEQYTGHHTDPGGSHPKVIWSDRICNFTVNDVAGAFALVMFMPKLDNMPSIYHQKYITRYSDVPNE